VDCHKFKPLALEEILAILEKKKISLIEKGILEER
jgi:hypothetical protein